MSANNEAIPLNIALLTVSDRHTADTDSTGALLKKLAQQAGHTVADQQIVTSDKYHIRALISGWIADDSIHAVIMNGGTGFAAKNCTVEAVQPLFDQVVDGFGEIFRQLSFQEIGSSSMQSRAVAGLANQTFIAAMPGSESASKLGWTQLIAPQLDSRQGPCNFVKQLTHRQELAGTGQGK